MREAEWTSGVYYRDGYYEDLVDGFVCPECGHENKFDGDDADLEICLGGSFCGQLLTCESCHKESKMPDSDY